MSSTQKTRALILVPFVVFIIATVFFALGYLVVIVLRMPSGLAFPLPVRLLGLVLVVSSLTFFSWLFTYRKPTDIIISTYVTFLKVGKRTGLKERSGRTESLVIVGPYRYVRHPLYFGVIAVVLGWWLLLDYSFLLLSALLLLLWFNFVVAPFEEVEFRAMFAEQYDEYAREVPRMIPFIKRHKTIENEEP